jgi:hypothetical protein
MANEKRPRWRQTGPGERLEVPAYSRHAEGDFMVGKRVLCGDRFSLDLVSEPFDGFVYEVDSEADGYGSAYLTCMRYPAELLSYGEHELALADRLMMIMRIGGVARHRVIDLAYQVDLDASVKDVLGALTELEDDGLVEHEANWWSLTIAGQGRRQALLRQSVKRSRSC